MINKNQIKIFNSEKEAGNLEGTLIKAVRINAGNDTMKNLFYFFKGKSITIQKLKNLAKAEAKNLNANYGVISGEYKSYKNLAEYFEDVPNRDEFQSIKVNFYKNK